MSTLNESGLVLEIIPVSTGVSSSVLGSDIVNPITSESYMVYSESEVVISTINEGQLYNSIIVQDPFVINNAVES